jgi:hypothetical protein
MYNDEKGLEEMAQLELDQERVYAEVECDDKKEETPATTTAQQEEIEEAVHREWVASGSAQSRERASMFIQTLIDGGKKEFKHFNLRSRSDSGAVQQPVRVKTKSARPKRVRHWEPLSIGTMVLSECFIF